MRLPIGWSPRSRSTANAGRPGPALTVHVWCSAAVGRGAGYGGPVLTPEQPTRQELIDATVRDPLADWPAVLDARRRPMSERLELALNWNKLASELRVGLAAAIERERQEARDEASETPGDEP